MKACIFEWACYITSTNCCVRFTVWLLVAASWQEEEEAMSSFPTSLSNHLRLHQRLGGRVPSQNTTFTSTSQNYQVSFLNVPFQNLTHNALWLSGEHHQKGCSICLGIAQIAIASPSLNTVDTVIMQNTSLVMEPKWSLQYPWLESLQFLLQSFRGALSEGVQGAFGNCPN